MSKRRLGIWDVSVTVLLGSVCLSILTLGCISDDKRCGSNFTFNEDDISCVPIDTGSDTTTDDTDIDAGEPDAASTDDDGLPSGLGTPCTTQGGDCDGFGADFCIQQPGRDQGYCTIQNCKTKPDDCPSGYECCKFSISGMPDFCATLADKELLGSMCEN